MGVLSRLGFSEIIGCSVLSSDLLWMQGNPRWGSQVSIVGFKGQFKGLIIRVDIPEVYPHYLMCTYK